jgi:hypothetical protein
MARHALSTMRGKKYERVGKSGLLFCTFCGFTAYIRAFPILI